MAYSHTNHLLGDRKGEKMEIVLRPSITVPIIWVLLFLLIFLGLFSKKKLERWQKHFGIALVTIVFLGGSFFLMRKTTVDINESGLKISGGINELISWDEIQSANYQKNYKHTEYEPTMSYGGAGLPGCSVGRFILANKKTASCILNGSASDAIVIDTPKGLYLLSFENSAEVFDEISKHTIVDNKSL
jgi:hypothetical protein